MPPKKKVVKSRVEKPHNAGTMSKSAFWGWVRSSLRNRTRVWKPVSLCKTEARRKYTGKNKLQKWEYQCNICEGWFKDKEIAVDHIIEAGALTCKEEAGDFIERLFCEVSGFQVLCNKREDGIESCHTKKTQEYMKNKKK